MANGLLGPAFPDQEIPEQQGLLGRISGGVTNFARNLPRALASPETQLSLSLLRAGQPQSTPVGPGGNLASGIENFQNQQLAQQLGQSRALLNMRLATQGGNPGAGNVQSVFRTNDGMLGIVRRNGEIEVTDQKLDESFQLTKTPSGQTIAVDRRDPSQAVEVVTEEEAVSGAAARKGAEAQASTAATESTKQQFELPQRIKAADTQIRSIDSTLEEAERALGLVSNTSAGVVGNLLQNIPGTDAFALNKALQPIKAALAFDKLSDMRAASPTGGALGQVSERELGLLQDSMVALEQAQNPGDVKRALNKILTHYNNWKAIIEQEKTTLQGQQQGSVSGFRIVSSGSN